MAKSVPQRMAIISAGVIMNLIFAVIFATIAYRCGVSYLPCVIGEAIPGDPAWVQGIRPGDKIVQFDNDRPSEHLRFDSDLMMGVLFTGAGNDLKLVLQPPGGKQGRQPDGKPTNVELVVQPTDAHKLEGGRSIIGVAPADNNQLVQTTDSASPTIPETPAAEAKPGFEGGDRIVAGEVDWVKHPLENGVQIEALLAQHADQPIKFTVLRGPKDDPTVKPKELAIHVSPALLRDLGIVMQMGPIKAVQKGSPADAAGFRPGDVIKSVDGKPVDDPMLLPQQMAKLVGKQVTVEVGRTDAGHQSTVALHVTPRPPLQYNRGGSNPVGCDALGIAYPVLNTVGGRSAAMRHRKRKSCKPATRSSPPNLFPTKEQKKQFEEAGPKFPTEALKFDDEHQMWPALAAMLQIYPSGVAVKLTVKRGDKEMSAMPSSIQFGRQLLSRPRIALETNVGNSQGRIVGGGWAVGIAGNEGIGAADRHDAAQSGQRRIVAQRLWRARHDRRRRRRKRFGRHSQATDFSDAA